MATIKQIDANRRNAQNATGPRTPEGKHAASLNALKTGIYAKSEVVSGERPEALAALAAEYHSYHRPTTPEARDLVDSLVRNSWLLRRLAVAEASLLNCVCDDCVERHCSLPDNAPGDCRPAADHRRLEALQRRINAAERNYHRSLKALQALPAPDPTPQPIDPESTSDKLVSFPQSTPQLDRRPDPPLPAAPDKGPPSSTSSTPPNPEVISAPPEPTLS